MRRKLTSDESRASAAFISGRTFVLPVEGAVPAAATEGVGLGVSLTIEIKEHD